MELMPASVDDIAVFKLAAVETYKKAGVDPKTAAALFEKTMSKLAGELGLVTEKQSRVNDLATKIAESIGHKRAQAVPANAISSYAGPTAKGGPVSAYTTPSTRPQATGIMQGGQQWSPGKPMTQATGIMQGGQQWSPGKPMTQPGTPMSAVNAPAFAAPKQPGQNVMGVMGAAAMPKAPPAQQATMPKAPKIA